MAGWTGWLLCLVVVVGLAASTPPPPSGAAVSQAGRQADKLSVLALSTYYTLVAGFLNTLHLHHI